MRGKVYGTKRMNALMRITPAYAGKSWDEIESLGYVLDHPRLCGEKQLKRTVKVGMEGSPPPMRGKAFRILSSSPPSRITPAYAGKSPTKPL